MSKYQGIKNMLLDAINENNNITDVEIDNYIDFLNNNNIVVGDKLNDNQLKVLTNDIKSVAYVDLSDGYCILNDYNYKPWFRNKKAELDSNYWDRYKNYLLKTKRFSKDVVIKLDSNLDNMTDLLGDPSSDGSFSRKGLIIGDVQSGKTANYIGLMNKASDAKYNVIIILTGTIEKLRQQTQLRVDEGFLGKSSSIYNYMNDSFQGVCVSNNTYPECFTSIENDFQPIHTTQLFKNKDLPNVFVIKKNVSILKKLYNWLDKNAEFDLSLLMIDDESDNASINTNKDDCDPTKTNDYIRKILNKFKRNSYVGFTATPYANVFINDNSEDDLFPKDYIYVIQSPSNYIGATSLFNDKAEYRKNINFIEDIHNYLPKKHNKYFAFTDIPSSLKTAIRTFFIANTLRDIRGNLDSHRTMLVNISRFISFHNQIANKVQNYVYEIIEDLKIYSCLPLEIALKNNTIMEFYDTFFEQYKDLDIKWDDVLNQLYKSNLSINVIVLNSKNSSNLNYELNKENGLRCIVVGGFSLSRGITLEGLLVSYFSRNSVMYDSLMQMGRWFGYRTGYEDIFRIWMDEENFGNFLRITESTEELKVDLNQMKEMQMKPKDFGIKIKNDINTLEITARNKMRSTDQIEKVICLSGEVIEATKIYNNKYNDQNIKCVKDELTEINKNYELINFRKSVIGFKNVSKKYVLSLINKINIPFENLKFICEDLYKFIEENNDLNKWDIALINGDGKKYKILEEEISLVKRSLSKTKDIGEVLYLNQGRLGSIDDGNLGISEEQKKFVKEKFLELNDNKNNITQKSYFKYLSDRNPLLNIYFLELNGDSLSDKVFVSFSLGFPNLDSCESSTVKYRINTVAQRNKMSLEYDYYDDGDDIDD